MFYVKGKIVNILGFAGHMVPITNALLCFDIKKAAPDNMLITKHGCTPNKTFYKRQQARFGSWAIV